MNYLNIWRSNRYILSYTICSFAPYECHKLINVTQGQRDIFHKTFVHRRKMSIDAHAWLDKNINGVCWYSLQMESAWALCNRLLERNTFPCHHTMSYMKVLSQQISTCVNCEEASHPFLDVTLLWRVVRVSGIYNRNDFCSFSVNFTKTKKNMHRRISMLQWILGMFAAFSWN